MHQIDSPTAATSLPVPSTGGTPGFFAAGNPAAGIPFTQTTNDWGNAVQGEIVNVIESAGLSLDKTDNTQLAQAITTMIASGFFRSTTGSGGSGLFFERLPDGTILQANSGISVTGNGDVITFATPFPHNCWYVIAQEAAPGGWVGCTLPTIFGVDTITATNFKLYNSRWNGSAFEPGGTLSYRYISLGF